MRNLILVTIFLIAVVIKGCYGDDIDSLNQRVKSLTTENGLLKSTIDIICVIICYKNWQKISGLTYYYYQL